LCGTKQEPSAERRSARVHGAVLDAAARLIRRHGYNRVTIEAIAAEAGAGKQTIYRWWPSKAALCIEICPSPPAKLAKAGGGTVAQDLRAVLGRLLRLFATAPARAIVAGLVAEARHDPGAAKVLVDRLVRRPRSLLREVLRRGVKRGQVRRTADIDLAAETLTSALWVRLLLGHASLDARFVERLVAQVMRGIAAK
jgi:AcrR family transcriptional regulator